MIIILVLPCYDTQVQLRFLKFTIETTVKMQRNHVNCPKMYFITLETLQVSTIRTFEMLCIFNK